jgi:hypothetical protein
MEKPKAEFPELLWPFLKVPDDYVVLDLETTGLFDEGGALHNMRGDIEGLHGALVDAKQTANVVEVLKECAKG